MRATCAALAYATRAIFPEPYWSRRPPGCRAWDWGKPLLLAPAMNTFMWESPFTEQHLAVCRRLGATVSAVCVAGCIPKHCAPFLHVLPVHVASRAL